MNFEGLFMSMLLVGQKSGPDLDPSSMNPVCTYTITGIQAEFLKGKKKMDAEIKVEYTETISLKKCQTSQIKREFDTDEIV